MSVIAMMSIYCLPTMQGVLFSLNPFSDEKSFIIKIGDTITLKNGAVCNLKGVREYHNSYIVFYTTAGCVHSTQIENVSSDSDVKVEVAYAEFNKLQHKIVDPLSLIKNNFKKNYSSIYRDIVNGELSEKDFIFMMYGVNFK